MKIWVSRELGTCYVEIRSSRPTWNLEDNTWSSTCDDYIDELYDATFGEITGVFVKEGEALHLDVQAVIMERLTEEVES